MSIRPNLYTSDQDAISSTYKGAINMAKTQNPFLVGVLAFLLNFLVGILAFIVKPFIRNKMGERSFGLITIIAAFFIYQFFEVATYKAFERVNIEKTNLVLSYKDSIRNLNDQLSILKRKSEDEFWELSHQMEDRLYNLEEKIKLIQSNILERKLYSNVTINTKDLEGALNSPDIVFDPLMSFKQMQVVFQDKNSSPEILKSYILKHTRESKLKYLNEEFDKISQIQLFNKGKNELKDIVYNSVNQAKNESVIFYFFLKFIFLLLSFAALGETWRRRIKNIKMHSYHRGNSLVFNWLVGKKIGNTFIQKLHINLSIEPLFLIIIGSFILNYIPKYSYVCIIPFIGAIGVFMEEYSYYNKRRNMLLDMVDAEIESEYLVTQKSTLVNESGATNFVTPSHQNEVGKATMP